MREQILHIREVSGVKLPNDNWSSMSGYEVTTNRQIIKLLIDDHQSCCESWGYFWTNDDIEEFIGAHVLDVKIVDECLNKEKAPEIYEGGVMFVDIETDRGVLQFVAYNCHNGYYGHSAIVSCEQLQISMGL